MDVQLKEQWVNALRSGDYGQSQKILRDPEDENAYCCLGVLCDLIDPDGWSYHEKFGWYWHDPETGAARDTYLPPSTAERVFGDRYGAKIPMNYKGDTKLVEVEVAGAILNDNGSTFEEIADWIEENL